MIQFMERQYPYIPFINGRSKDESALERPDNLNASINNPQAFVMQSIHFRYEKVYSEMNMGNYLPNLFLKVMDEFRESDDLDSDNALNGNSDLNNLRRRSSNNGELTENLKGYFIDAFLIGEDVREDEEDEKYKEVMDVYQRTRSVWQRLTEEERLAVQSTYNDHFQAIKDGSKQGDKQLAGNLMNTFNKFIGTSV